VVRPAPPLHCISWAAEEVEILDYNQLTLGLHIQIRVTEHVFPRVPEVWSIDTTYHMVEWI